MKKKSGIGFARRARRGRILRSSFFERPTLNVARELLGKYLVRAVGENVVAARITEVEAYDGPNDRASHASRGLTRRNRVMFGPAGVWYVYYVYGMHDMLNIVTGSDGYPAAVLIRGIEGVSGPGRITKYFGITKAFNNRAATRANDLWIEDRGERTHQRRIVRLPRVGVAYAGPLWSGKPYRFMIKP